MWALSSLHWTLCIIEKDLIQFPTKWTVLWYSRILSMLMISYVSYRKLIYLGPVTCRSCCQHIHIFIYLYTPSNYFKCIFNDILFSQNKSINWVSSSWCCQNAAWLISELSVDIESIRESSALATQYYFKFLRYTWMLLMHSANNDLRRGCRAVVKSSVCFCVDDKCLIFQ